MSVEGILLQIGSWSSVVHQIVRALTAVEHGRSMEQFCGDVERIWGLESLFRQATEA